MSDRLLIELEAQYWKPLLEGWITKGQLKDIVDQARKAERERLIKEIEDKGLGTLGSIHIRGDIWQSIKGEGDV